MGVPAELNRLTEQIIGAAIEVHRRLGPGLVESVYETAMDHELALRGIARDRQVPIRIPYKDIEISGQRLDLLVEGKVIVELKAVESLAPIHRAQLLSYLRAAHLRVGLLINFNVPKLVDGVVRRVR